MSFQTEGKLGERPIYKVLQDVIRTKATGVLTIQGESDTIMMAFELGLCVSVESHYPKDNLKLGNLLTKRGFLSEVQLQDILEKQKKTFLKLGYLARDAKYITLNQLLDVLEDQVLLILFPCLTWKNGLFFFRAEDAVPYDRDSSRLLDLTFVASKGEEILKNYAWICQRLPDHSAIPVLNPETQVVSSGVQPEDIAKSDTRAIILTPEQERVYNLINGVYSVDEICNTCHQFKWMTLKSIVDLDDLGVITIPAVETSRQKYKIQWLGTIQKFQSVAKYAAIGSGIVLVLVSISFIPIRFIPKQDSSKLEIIYNLETVEKINQIRFALASYRIEKGDYPEFINDLADAGILTEKDLLDAWEQKFYYRRFNKGYTIISEGGDEKWATSDDFKVEDFDNWDISVSFFPGELLRDF